MLEEEEEAQRDRGWRLEVGGRARGAWRLEDEQGWRKRLEEEVGGRGRGWRLEEEQEAQDVGGRRMLEEEQGRGWRLEEEQEAPTSVIFGWRLEEDEDAMRLARLWRERSREGGGAVVVRGEDGSGRSSSQTPPGRWYGSMRRRRTAKIGK
jgi:hypothetical protein